MTTTTLKHSHLSHPSHPSHPSPKKVGVALYGYGTVGSALARIIHDRSDWLARTHGITLAIRQVTVRDLQRERVPQVARDDLTGDYTRGFRNPGVDVVVELIGGTGVALEVAHGALAFGKHFVTANKAVVAAHGAELEALAERSGVLLRYEGAVGGAIPVLRTLRTSLATDRVKRIRGIVNGTTNFILTRMEEDGLPFFRALGKAGELGYAEADATADVSGADAAQKLTILARHALGRWLPVSAVKTTGIESVSMLDFTLARSAGCTIKLIADADLSGATPALKVGVETVQWSDPFAGVRNEQNAIHIEAESAGPIVLMGRGAGGLATASAVYADLVEAATS